ncbi:hypothetical protein [Craurococcus roseus]|uniref:hypothetical protein n=1 Tax=Craurococcus roseus TaxID=77585 RepID=UPI0031E19541
MPRISSGGWTPHAKKMRARLMYQRGQSFLLAAAFLKEKDGRDRYAVLYLLCQGLEVILKSLLLMKDYEKHKPELKKTFGHNVSKLAEQVLREFSLNDLKPSLREELSVLNSLYHSPINTLRYASFIDILVDPVSISTNLVERRLMALQRLVKRKLAPM